MRQRIGRWPNAWGKLRADKPAPVFFLAPARWEAHKTFARKENVWQRKNRKSTFSSRSILVCRWRKSLRGAWRHSKQRKSKNGERPPWRNRNASWTRPNERTASWMRRSNWPLRKGADSSKYGAPNSSGADAAAEL